MQKRDRLKKLYHFDNGDENSLIDCRKIVTCFADALFEYKIFTFQIKNGLILSIYRFQEQL